MPDERYLALLRGINVGGKNVIAKDDLRQCFVDLGFEQVRTYIQSGNILFRSTRRSVPKLTTTVEKRLADRFSYDARAVVMSYHEYVAAVDAAPAEWGHDDTFKHNALFTLAGITPEQVLAELPAPKPRIEAVGTGPGVLYWSASKTDLGRTTIMKLGQSPMYRRLTVRNHNTVHKLRAMLEET